MHSALVPAPLPLREGISPNAVFLPQGEWATVFAFLCARFLDVSAAQWAMRMSKNEVVFADGTVITPQCLYPAGRKVFYYREIENETVVPFSEKIIFENEHLIVADKPHFLPVAPSGRYLKETLISRLKHKTGMDFLVPLHRLDRETAGLLLVSKNIHSRDAYHGLFRTHTVKKTYQAIAPFNAALEFPLLYKSRIVEADEFYRRKETQGEPNAFTQLTIIEQKGELARYELQPITGKTHQLRVHMAALGMPIKNDRYYPTQTHWPNDDFMQPLQLLAKTLAFTDPVTGQAMLFESSHTLHF